jgi:hypothetical protein
VTRLSLDPTKPQLTENQKADLKANIDLLRDAIVLFTATGAARGVSGHTGKSTLIAIESSNLTRMLSRSSLMRRRIRYRSRGLHLVGPNQSLREVPADLVR